MRRLLAITLLLLSFATLHGQDFRLSFINGRATIKSFSLGQWRSLSNHDVGQSLDLRDSISVVSKSLFVDSYKKGIPQDSYQADPGNWTVDDIIKGKAYNTNRPLEESGESIKGDMESFFFDVIVEGEPTTIFHYGDHPMVRLINDSSKTVFFALLWLEGQTGWNMLDQAECPSIPPKSSLIVKTKDAFVIGPPAGRGDVILVVSDFSFQISDALTNFTGHHNNLNYLVKHIAVTE